MLHRRAKGTTDQPAGEQAVDVTVVAVDDELGRLRSRLQQALGPGYQVVAGSSVEDAAATVVPARLTRIEMLRSAHPKAFIVVYDDGANEPAAYLEARADDYVSSASMAELAARIRAGLRRLSWQRPNRR